METMAIYHPCEAFKVMEVYDISLPQTQPVLYPYTHTQPLIHTQTQPVPHYTLTHTASYPHTDPSHRQSTTHSYTHTASHPHTYPSHRPSPSLTIRTLTQPLIHTLTVLPTIHQNCHNIQFTCILITQEN